MAQFQRHSSQMKVVKPFCKVCFDAGKSETEYTSHFVKSEPGIRGKVVCPTLLNQACTYCYETGHTVKFCKVLAQNNKKYYKEEKKQKYYESKGVISNQHKKSKAKKVQNTFSALDSDCEPEEPIKGNLELEQFPVLCEPSTPPYPPPGEEGSTTPPYPPPDFKEKTLSYASMAAKSPKLLSLCVPEDRGSREPSVPSGGYAPRSADYHDDDLSGGDNTTKHKTCRRSDLKRILKWGEDDSDQEDNYPKYKTEWANVGAGYSFRKWGEEEIDDEEDDEEDSYPKCRLHVPGISQARKWSEWESSDDEE